MSFAGNDNSTQNIGIYKNYVIVLKVLQILGYSVIVISGFRLNTQVFFDFGDVIIFIIFFSALNYVTTQGLIAIVELLSRIEYNTRSLRNQDNQE